VTEGSEGGSPGLSTAALVADGEPTAAACAGGRGGRCPGWGVARGPGEAHGGKGAWQLVLRGSFLAVQSARRRRGSGGVKTSLRRLEDEVYATAMMVAPRAVAGDRGVMLQSTDGVSRGERRGSKEVLCFNEAML
jgi:hypothetical protein